MSSSDGNIYINDLTTGNELSPFELVVDSTTNPTTTTRLITPNTAKADYDVESTSFVVGSDRLNDDSSVTTKDNRMFFDKPNGAFRAGSVVSNQWDDSNRGANSTALGLNNIASGANSFAAGSGNTASGDSSVAIGNGNNAVISNTVAIGLTNHVSGGAPAVVSAAIGALNIISPGSTGSFAIGTSNNAIGPGNQSVLIGASNTSSDGHNGVAIGEYNSTSAGNATAIGQYCTASGANSVSIGYGTDSSAMNTASGTGSVAIGHSNSSTGADSVTIGEYCTASGANSFAIGYGDSPSVQNTAGSTGSTGSIAIGHNNSSTGADSVAMGQYCTAYGANSFAIGQFCTAGASDGDGENSVAIGYGTSDNKNTAGNRGSVSIGYQNDSTGVNSVAIGSNNAATGNYSFAIGSGCNTNAVTGSICMGTKANIDISSLPSVNNFFWNGDVDTNGYVAPHKYSNSNQSSINPLVENGGGICFWGSPCGEFRIGFGNNKATDNYSNETDADLLASSIQVGILYKAGDVGWGLLSDINKKENLIEHDYEDTLDKIMEMPVYTYNFISYGQKNIGPVAQDFNRLFPSDSDPLMISSGSLAGVTLAGVKGVKLGLDNLSTSVDSRFASNSDATSALQSRIAVLESSLTTASAQIAAMEGRLAALEQ